MKFNKPIKTRLYRASYVASHSEKLTVTKDLDIPLGHIPRKQLPWLSFFNVKYTNCINFGNGNGWIRIKD